MMRTPLIGLLIGGLIVAAAGAACAQQADRELPEGVEMIRDIVYGKGGEVDLKLNLVLPENRETPRPAVVFIHGGAWRGGGPGQFEKQAIYLAERGYVCACIAYRLVPEGQFPGALEDAKCAVRWMRAHAEEYGVDTDRITVAGGSAGGHLAAMIATTGLGEFEGEGGWQDESSEANCAVLFNPVCDMTNMGSAEGDHAAVVAFLGKSSADDPDLYAQASPITHISNATPPTLILHGTEDTTVPYTQAVAFVDALKELGVPAELFTAAGASHAFFNRDPWYQPTLEAMYAFLEEHLGPAMPGVP